MMIKSAKKYVFMLFGSISLVLGIIGVIIPILPTTPFLLLSSFFYLRSSNRLYQWLIHHKIFGSYIYNYLTYKAVKQSSKIGALVFLWLSLLISISIVASLHLTIFLIIVGICVSIHLLTLKTLKKEEFMELSLSKENRL